MPEFDPYVLGLTILVLAQWALQALRDRKVTPDEWSQLIDLVASRVIAAADSQKHEKKSKVKTKASKATKTTNKTKTKERKK